MNSKGGSRSGVGARSVLDQMSKAEAAEQQLHRTRSLHTVLVVDDTDALRYATSKSLQQAGYSTIEAATGEEAILKAASAAAVVLDVNLPDMNGVEVLRSIKSECGGKPVVLTSAVFVNDLHRAIGCDAGADAYLLSPLQSSELAFVVDRLLQAAASRSD
jgi:CheY-like chemotaxis protein